MYVIIIYDIADENHGQKRWKKVFKLCKQSLRHIQNSVFEGEVTQAELFALEKQIQNEIDRDLDSVIVFKSRNEKWLDKDILGKEMADHLFI